jgi:hypothetical protein
VQSRKTKPEPNITEAAEKTGVVLRGLQSRLLEGAGAVVEEPGESKEDLENQLQEYFKNWTGHGHSDVPPLRRLRNHVVDGVVERILRGWQAPESNPLESEVVERLIDGVIEILVAGDAAPGAASNNAPGRMPRSFSAAPKPASAQFQ